MAIRIQQYSTPPRRIQAGGIDPGFSSPLIRDAGRNGTADVVDAMLKAGMQITEVGIREYVKDQTAAVSQSLLNLKSELTAERDRYMAQNKGQNAIGAGDHFRRFADEAVQRHLDKGQFSGRFREMFMSQAVGTGLHFTEQGQAYGRQQKSTWEDSVLKGDLAEFEQQIARNYDNPEWIEFSMQGLRQRIEAMKPGMDLRALYQELDSLVHKSRLTGLIADGRYDEAERLLGGGGISAGGGGGSLSARNLAANNFGNVKNSAGGFNAYATREDGLMGVGERVLRYSNAPERGWNARTLEAMTAIYAPDSDGNDSKAYAAFLGEKLGISPDAKINFRDPKILSGLIRWMPVMEHGGDRVKISAEEAEAAARALLRGEKPRITGEAEKIASGSTGKDSLAPGQLEAGNIDLYNRPVVKNPDGSISTVRTISFNADGKEIVIPTVSDDGRILSDEDAIALYEKTGKHFGKFDTPDHATAYAQKLHEDQERLYVPREQQASRPSPSWLSPADRMKFQGMIEAGKRKRVEESIVTQAQSILDFTRGMDATERVSAALEQVSRIGDIRERNAVHSLVNRELAFQDVKEKAADANAARDLAAATRDMDPVEREQHFVQSGVSQTVRNMATELLNTGTKTDAVALSQAKEDISNGMSIMEVSSKYGVLINARDMEDLRSLSVNEERKKANRQQNAFFRKMVAESGLDIKNEEDLAFLNEVRVELEEKIAAGDFKTPLEQKNWIYEQLARRINLNGWWPDGKYTPREALGQDDAVLPVPRWEEEEIRRQLAARGIFDPTEEQVQQVYAKDHGQAVGRQPRPEEITPLTPIFW